jgi:hypothetical protein
MKSISVVFLVLLFQVSVLQAQNQPPIQKGRVKSVTVFEEKADMLIRKQYKESETWYDQQGNILEEIKYDEGKVVKHFKYQYDTDGNKIREEEYDPSGRLTELSEYRFEDGLRIEKVVYDPNHKVRSRKTYTYTKF